MMTWAASLSRKIHLDQQPENFMGEGQGLFSPRMLIGLILPLMLEQLLAVTIGMADTVMVTGVGEAAISAVSLVDSINVLLIQLFAAFSTGGAVVCSQYMGRKEPNNASNAAKQLLYFSFALSLFLAVIAVSFNRQILQLVFGRVDEDVMRYAETYFWLSAVSYPFFSIYNACAAFLRSMGKSRIALYLSAMMNIINVGFNALFIFGFHMGVGGAAFSSLIARMAGAIVALLLLCRPGYPIHIEKLFNYRPDRKMLGRILRIGIPTGAENSMFQLGKLLLSGLIATFGTASISANAICGTLANFSNVPGSGIGLGAVTVVGHCMGAGKPKQAEKYTKYLIGANYLFMSVVSAILFICAPSLCRAFGLGDEAYGIAVLLLRGFTIASVIWPPSFMLPNTLRAAGDAKFTMWVSLISMFLCRVSLAFVLAWFTNLGVHAVWIAMYADWLVRAIFFVIRFARGKWKLGKVI